MTTPTPTLAEWLLDRIAEDEREADVMMRQYQSGGDVSSRRWRRVLAECGAKRRIVELHDEALHAEFDRRDASAMGAWLMHQDVLRALASVYADAPGFREEWRA